MTRRVVFWAPDGFHRGALQCWDAGGGGYEKKSRESDIVVDMLVSLTQSQSNLYHFLILITATLTIFLRLVTSRSVLLIAFVRIPSTLWGYVRHWSASIWSRRWWFAVSVSVSRSLALLRPFLFRLTLIHVRYNHTDMLQWVGGKRLLVWVL